MAEGTTIWVQSDPLPDGTYVTAIHYDDDRSRVLDHTAGLAYVTEVLRAAVQAEHDAAVIRHLMATGLGPNLAASVVADLRADRPPIDDAATAPLTLRPGVSQKTMRGFLAIHMDGRQVGQWEPAEAREHAVQVLEVLTAADLDAAYRRHLIGPLGVDEPTAMAIVSDLAAYIGKGRPS